MHTSDGRHVIVYNGEIYNFKELRCELEKEGRRFVSQTDSEVALAAFAEWGEDALTRFNGMFAFAFWMARKAS
jgi:asparagine synthase (glutamine-hydrolysing)